MFKNKIKSKKGKEPIIDVENELSNNNVKEGKPIPRRRGSIARNENDDKRSSFSTSFNGLVGRTRISNKILRKPKNETFSNDETGRNRKNYVGESEERSLPRRSLRISNMRNNFKDKMSSISTSLNSIDGIHRITNNILRKPKMEPTNNKTTIKEGNLMGESERGSLPRRSLRLSNIRKNFKNQNNSIVTRFKGLGGIPRITKKTLGMPKTEPYTNDKKANKKRNFMGKSEERPIPRRSLRLKKLLKTYKEEVKIVTKNIMKNARSASTSHIVAARTDPNGLYEGKPITRRSLKSIANINNNDSANNNENTNVQRKSTDRKGMKSTHCHLCCDDEKASGSTSGLHKGTNFKRAKTVPISNVTESVSANEENPITRRNMKRPNSEPISYDNTANKKENQKTGRRSLGRLIVNKPSYYLNCFAQENHQSPIYSVAFNHCLLKDNENLIFATCGSNRCTVYECPKNGGLKLLLTFADPDPEETFFTCTWSYDITNDSPLIAVGGYRGIIRIIDVYKNKAIRNLFGHGQSINELKFHPKKPDILLSASKDHGIRLWNVYANVLIAILGGVDGHRDEVLSIDFDKTGDRIMSSGMDHALKLWRLDKPEIQKQIALSRNFKNTNKPFQTIGNHFPDYSTRDIHRNYIDCVRWFGDFILSKSCENSIICWKPGQLNQSYADLQANNPQATFITEFKYRDGDLWFIRFDINPRELLLASGNQYGKVYVWELDPKDPNKTGSIVLSHPKCTSPIRQVAFSEDASVLIYVSDDGKVWRWNRHDIPNN